MLKFSSFVMISGVVLLLLSAVPKEELKQEVIIQGNSLTEIIEQVEAIGGKISHKFKIINSVGASLTNSQIQSLEKTKGIRKIYKNHSLNTSTENDQPVVGDEDLIFNNKDVKWKLTNNSNEPQVISAISITWPAGNQTLEGTYLQGRVIQGDDFFGPFVTLQTNWQGDESSRTIEPNRTRTLKFHFKQRIQKTPSEYAISVRFESGAITTFRLNEQNPGEAAPLKTHYPTLVGAHQLHEEEIYADGVAVAVIDTGLTSNKQALAKTSDGESRVLAFYNAITNSQNEASKLREANCSTRASDVRFSRST